MTLVEQIMQAIPELTIENFGPFDGRIVIRDDSDGFGPYIEKWEYPKPLPEGMKVGKN